MRIACVLLACILALAVSHSRSALAATDAAATHTPSAFSESLLVRPLHDGKLHMHWQFELHESGSGGRHFSLFSKALGEILWSLRVHSLSLSLSSGRWIPELFGDVEGAAPAQAEWTTRRVDNGSAELGAMPVPRTRHAPLGAELWAVIESEQGLASATNDTSATSASAAAASVHGRWMELQAALSGLFCASLNQMTAATTSNPEALIREERAAPSRSAAPAPPPTGFRYATLPRESVCTENLSPFVKMLPCRRERGLAAMLNPLKLFRSHFHSIQLRVDPLFHPRTGRLDGWSLRQSVSVLMDPMLAFKSPSWNLVKLVGEGADNNDAQGAACSCPLSQRSALHLHLTPAFSARFPDSIARLVPPSADAPSRLDSSRTQFELTAGPSSAPPQLVRQARGHTMLSYDLKRISAGAGAYAACPRGSLNLAMQYTPPKGQEETKVFAVRELLGAVESMHPPLSPLELPIVVHRYLSAPTLHSGTLHIHLRNPSSTQAFLVHLFDALPWFVQVSHSSLSLTVSDGAGGEGRPMPPEDVLERHYTPGVLRGPPSQFSFLLRLRAHSSVSLSLQFGKTLLTSTEYPPDVSRGFDIGSAIVRVTPEGDEGQGGQACGKASDDHDDAACGAASVLWYTDGLLLLLPFPDFSMPFNVIAFTSTLIAFFFGSVLNVTQSPYAMLLKRAPRPPLGRDGLPVDQSLFGKAKKWAQRKCGKKKATAKEAPKGGQEAPVAPAVDAEGTNESKEE